MYENYTVHIFIIQIAMPVVQDIAIFVLFINIGYFGQVHENSHRIIFKLIQLNKAII